jgi:hypothetical protein
LLTLFHVFFLFCSGLLYGFLKSTSSRQAELDRAAENVNHARDGKLSVEEQQHEAFIEAEFERMEKRLTQQIPDWNGGKGNGKRKRNNSE